MQCTTKWGICYWRWGSIAHTIAVWSLVVLPVQCPLQLAGYEVAKLPMAQLCRGWALQWPASAFKELVPNV